MDCIATRIPYRQTGHFSKIICDYIDQDTSLKDFYAYTPNIQGIHKAIEERKTFSYDRDTLVRILKEQYDGVQTSGKTAAHINSLSSNNTFTLTTAHQNNIFTGPLYFIYKILHTIRLADYCKSNLPEYNFVPVFYIGSEDADFDELNHIYLGDEKLTWHTNQTGAVGRMKIDKDLVKLISKIEGQIAVLPFGKEITELTRSCYREEITIADATFRFVNAMFGEYGLVILQPDHPDLKKQMIPIFRDDLLQQAASGVVEKTAEKLSAAGYKVQANPREINLFYLDNDIRERIIYQNDIYYIQHTKTRFDEASILKELDDHPERFSPNVILRGLFQETILPNLAFIGGGGETAYWLQLKDLFIHYKVPFPVLVLRNSFLVVEKKWSERILKLGFTTEDFFSAEHELMERLVTRIKGEQIKLNGSLTELEELYESFKKQASEVDVTLAKHVEALKLRTVHRLQELEKKMLRAEKRKFADQQRQISAIKNHLFPGNGLQERYENISYYYALWGKDFIRKIYDASLSLEHEFVVIREK